MKHLLWNCSFARCYLDDVFVASNYHNQHIRYMWQILSTLSFAKLRINPDKCILVRREMKKKKFRLVCTQKLAAAFRKTARSCDDNLALVTESNSNQEVGIIGSLPGTKFSSGSWYPLDFFSRKLSSTRKATLPTIVSCSLSLLPIGIQRFLEGQFFTVFTNHRLLVYAAQ